MNNIDKCRLGASLRAVCIIRWYLTEDRSRLRPGADYESSSSRLYP